MTEETPSTAKQFTQPRETPTKHQNLKTCCLIFGNRDTFYEDSFDE